MSSLLPEQLLKLNLNETSISKFKKVIIKMLDGNIYLCDYIKAKNSQGYIGCILSCEDKEIIKISEIIDDNSMSEYINFIEKKRVSCSQSEYKKLNENLKYFADIELVCYLVGHDHLYNKWLSPEDNEIRKKEMHYLEILNNTDDVNIIKKIDEEMLIEFNCNDLIADLKNTKHLFSSNVTKIELPITYFLLSPNQGPIVDIHTHKIDPSDNDIVDKLYKINNVIIAGGFVSGYVTYRNSHDIDIFIYGLKGENMKDKVIELCNIINKGHNYLNKEHIWAKTKHSLTYKNGYKIYQIILHEYKSKSQILMSFDIDACCVCMSKDSYSEYETTKRGYRGLTKYSLLDPRVYSINYEERINKYVQRGYPIAIPGYNGVEIDSLLPCDIKSWGLQSIIIKNTISSKLSAEIILKLNLQSNNKSNYGTIDIDTKIWKMGENFELMSLRELYNKRIKENSYPCLYNLDRKYMYINDNLNAITHDQLNEQENE
jgi:hypothetical protein